MCGEADGTTPPHYVTAAYTALQHHTRRRALRRHPQTQSYSPTYQEDSRAERRRDVSLERTRCLSLRAAARRQRAATPARTSTNGTVPAAHSDARTYVRAANR